MGFLGAVHGAGASGPFFRVCCAIGLKLSQPAVSYVAPEYFLSGIEEVTKECPGIKICCIF